MTIRDFALQYCQDIIEESKRRAAMFDFSEFSHDEVIVEEDGTRVPVVNTERYQIPVADILGMDREEFSRCWPYPECLDAYDLYVSNLIILEGTEALTHIRNKLRTACDRIAAYDNIPEVFR